ncbi:mitochondrial export Som1 [Lecanosticta acicola]|uniref:Mitochondrial export Som1 n=1 Tax=Lecanosticta acicola TaxID=111012 RepID=A0AAI8W0T0_9PEZI|nr:mitochondrial export Som1 [Lecanosticta acicola]
MAPLVESFTPAELASRINKLPSGKARKPAVADLAKDCELKELIQYNCDLNGPREDPRSKVVCEPVLRLFRQCANGLTVETTAWEGRFGR